MNHLECRDFHEITLLHHYELVIVRECSVSDDGETKSSKMARLSYLVSLKKMGSRLSWGTAQYNAGWTL